MSSSVKDVYNRIALLLSDLNFAYHVNKERKDSSAKVDLKSQYDVMERDRLLAYAPRANHMILRSLLT